jgi:hypothetical protein
MARQRHRTLVIDGREHVGILVQHVPGLIPKPIRMNLPFEHLTAPEFKYETLLIETPILLKRLMRISAPTKVEFKHKTFTNAASVLGLQKNIIANCTLGAKDEGHSRQGPPGAALASTEFDLPLQPKRLICSREGTRSPLAAHRVAMRRLIPNQAISQQLVDYMKGVFGVAPVVPLPKFHTDHPDYRPYVAREKVVGP